MASLGFNVLPTTKQSIARTVYIFFCDIWYVNIYHERLILWRSFKSLASSLHNNNVMTWKCVRHYWQFVRKIYRFPVDFHHKGAVMRFFVFSSISACRKPLNKPSSCRWLKMSWRSCDVIFMPANLTSHSCYSIFLHYLLWEDESLASKSTSNMNPPLMPFKRHMLKY